MMTRRQKRRRTHARILSALSRALLKRGHCREAETLRARARDAYARVYTRREKQ
jgi:hypothetical protein